MSRKGNEIEERELAKIEERIYKIDFSRKVDAKLMKEKILKENRLKRGINMKKQWHIKRIMTASAAAVLGCCLLMQTTFAQKGVSDLLKRFTIGSSTYEQMDPDTDKSTEVPEPLKGKLFTKDGKVITKFEGHLDGFYDKDGNEVVNFNPVTGELTTKEQQQETIDGMLVERDIQKINSHLNFKIKLPAYVPEGYKFDRAQYYEEKTEDPESGINVDIYYKNEETGDEIYILERKACDINRGCLRTDDTLTEIEINGAKAILRLGSIVYWEDSEVIYMYDGGAASTEDIIKSASSMKAVE